jgi:hypothetical protein
MTGGRRVVRSFETLVKLELTEDQFYEVVNALREKRSELSLQMKGEYEAMRSVDAGNVA